MSDIRVYQQWTRKHWRDNGKDANLQHALLGLAGEVGEVIEPYKKHWFTPDRIVELNKEELTKELGDVLYYLCRIADEEGLDMQDVIEANVDKLETRYGKSN